MTASKRDRIDRERHAARLAAIGITPGDARRLRRMSARLRRLFEEDCDIRGAEERNALEESRIEERARELVRRATAGRAELYVQGDCRGSALYVIPPDVLRHYAGSGYTIDRIYTQGVAL